LGSRDVKVVEEVFVHETVIGLQFVFGHWEVFIQIEGVHILEGKSSFVHFYQFGVDPNRG
jgi:hypothetical protein